MDSDKNEQIKARAYQIWENEGRPHGRQDEHWHKAAEEIGAASTAGNTGSVSHPGMMGDGTEEQNLDQPGNPAARITEDEVKEAFGTTTK